MTIGALCDILKAELLVEGSKEVCGGYTSDLLSDVMAHASSGDALITIQAHRNTVAVAGLMGCPAVIICNGREAPDEMKGAAKEEGIAILRVAENQFQVSGLLWAALYGASAHNAGAAPNTAPNVAPNVAPAAGV